MIVDAPVLPLALAVTIAVPAATPVTRPVCVTVATEPFDVDHVKVAVAAGFDVAVSCVAAPA